MVEKLREDEDFFGWESDPIKQWLSIPGLANLHPKAIGREDPSCSLINPVVHSPKPATGPLSLGSP